MKKMSWTLIRSPELAGFSFVVNGGCSDAYRINIFLITPPNPPILLIGWKDNAGNSSWSTKAAMTRTSASGAIIASRDVAKRPNWAGSRPVFWVSVTSGPASKFRCPKLDLLPAGVTKNNFRSYGYASDFSFSQRPKYLRF
jgi:hypothetical protein